MPSTTHEDNTHRKPTTSTATDNRQEHKKNTAENITAADIAAWCKAKVQNYYRCLTCDSHPVRHLSHFVHDHRRTTSGRHCRRQQLTGEEQAVWITEHMNTIRRRREAGHDRGTAATEIIDWYKTKATLYYRCLTCTSQPVREQSHFRHRLKRNGGIQCQRRQLTRTEAAAWMVEQAQSSRIRTRASEEMHRIVANARRSQPCLTMNEHNRKQQESCSICTTRYPGVECSAGHHCCGVCHQCFRLNKKSQRSNHQQRPRVALVCTVCRGSGYVPNDLRSYECQCCGNFFGRNSFTAVAIQNFNRRKRGTMTCISCTESMAGTPAKTRHT